MVFCVIREVAMQSVEDWMDHYRSATRYRVVYLLQRMKIVICPDIRHHKSGSEEQSDWRYENILAPLNAENAKDANLQCKNDNKLP
jgi:hypothetical protein